MPLSKEEWEKIQRGMQKLNNRTQVTESSSSYTPNQNVVNKLRAAHYASENANLRTPQQNKKTAENLFGGAFSPKGLVDTAYEDLSDRTSEKFNKEMEKAEKLFGDKTNLSYSDAKDEVEFQKELQNNKKKADIYAAQGGTDRDEYEAALNKESTDAYYNRKAVKDFSYEYSNQSRDEMAKEQENLQKQYDAETDQYKKFAIGQQMQKAKSYSDSLLSSKEVQQKIDENQKIIDDYTKKYVAEGLNGVTQEEIDAYAKAREDLSYYKNLLNPAIVNEYDDDVYSLEPDDMQAFSIVYQYDKQKENDTLMDVESNDPLRQQLEEQYNQAYSYLKQKYTDKEIKEMSKKFTYVADRDMAYQTSKDIVDDLADKTGAKQLPYLVGLGLGTALDAYNAPMKIVDGLVQSLTGQPINVYDSTYSIAMVNEAIQQGIISQSANQKASSMALGIYCSLVQMGATMGAGMVSGVEQLSLFLMGSSAASQTIKDMAEKGASNDKIIVSAIATGVAEALFEKVSLEGWIHPENILASARLQASLGETVKALLAQMGCEVSEEICTDVANEITDYLINGGNSNAAMTIEAYKNMGYSQKQAENMYLMDFGEQLSDTALSSAIISAFMSPSSVISTDVQIDRAVQTAQWVANMTYGDAEAAIRDYVLSGQSSEDTDNIIEAAMKSTINEYAPKSADIEKVLLDTYNEATNAKYTVKGEEKTRSVTEMSEKDVKKIADFAAKRGVNVRFATFNKRGQLVDSNGKVIFTNGANGFYTNENGQRTVYLNPRANANTSLSFLAGHEIAHDMQGTEQYETLKEMVFDFLDRNVLRDGKTVNELEQTIQRATDTYYDEYKNMGMSDEQIRTAIEEEIVADALGVMLKEGNLLRYVSDYVQGWQHGIPKLMENIRNMYKNETQTQKIFSQYLKAYNTQYSSNALGGKDVATSIGESVIIGNNTLNYDNLNDEGMRKLVEYANKHKASWQLKNVNGEQTIGRYVRDEFVPVSENTLKSIIKKYNEDNDTIASDVYDFVSSSTDSEIDNTYKRALQDDKNIADNIINAEATKAGAITENGHAQHIYLGTTSFGYTVSNPQYAATGSAIWTSTSQAVAKGYAMTDNIQGAPSSRVRPISSAYVEDDGTIKTLLKNAKNILNIEYTDVNSEIKKKFSSQLVEYIEKENNKIAEAIQGGIVQNNTELFSSYPSGTDGLYNDAMKLLDYTEALNPRFNDYYDDFTKEQIQAFIADWNSAFKDAYGRLKKFFYDHQAEINNSDAQKFFSIIDGYELSDFLIDVESFIDKLYSGDRVLSYESPMSPFGVFFVNESDVRAAIDRFKNFGTYDLYGFAGDKPLVVDAEGASWLGIKFPQLGEDRTWSTDRIVKWAQDNGYTSVNIKNVYDNAYNGADGDDWVFFDAEQIKSADTVTYDENNKIIPPSERFDSAKKDMRWSKGASSVEDFTALNNEYETALKDDRNKAKEMLIEQAERNGYYVGDVHHGRVSLFTVFDRAKGNRGGDWGNGFYFSDNLDDVEQNYSTTEGGDLRAKIDNYAEKLMDSYYDGDFVVDDPNDLDDNGGLKREAALRMAEEHYISAEPNVLDAFLKIENPIVIDSDGGTIFDIEYDEDTDEYTGTFVDFMEALKDTIDEEYDYVDYRPEKLDELYAKALDWDGMDARAIEKYVKSIIWGADVDGEESWAGDVLAHTFERMGFDGIIDHTVGYKFSMDGLTHDTTHYIVFNSNQIKDASLETYDDNGKLIPLSERFNDKNEDIRWSKGNPVVANFGITEEQRKAIDQFNKDYADEYMQAAESGDEATCTRILKEKAKLLGAWSKDGKEATDLFIGTDEFGYTVNDPSKTDWWAQFFATDDLAVAGTYVKNNVPRTIESANRGLLSGDTDLIEKSLKKISEESGKTYRLASQEERKQVIGKMVKYLDLYLPKLYDYVDTYAEHLKNNDEEVSYPKTILYDRIKETLGDFTNYLHKIWNGDIVDIGKVVADFREISIRATLIGNTELKYLLGGGFFAPLEEIASYANQKFIALDDQNISIGLEELYDKYGGDGGIYAVYGYVGNNPLIVECNGCNWNRIPFAPLGTGTYRTREVAEYAQEHNYTSVIFKDLVDIGEYGGSYNSSTVFTFFNSEQLKSADPITYDDNGKIIPLENRLSLEYNERIGEKFLDMRYQRGESTVESNGDWEELRRLYGEEEPVQTPQTPTQPTQNIQSDVEIKDEILAPVGEYDNLMERTVRINGKPEPLIAERRKENLVTKMQDFGKKAKQGAGFLMTKLADSAYVIHDTSVKHNTDTYKWFTDAKSASSMSNNVIGGYIMKDGKPEFTGNMVDMTGAIRGKSVSEILYPYAHADSQFLEAHNTTEEKHMDECQEYLVMLLNRDEINRTGKPRITTIENRDVRRTAKAEGISYQEARAKLSLDDTQKAIDRFENEYGKDYAQKLVEANRTICDFWLSLDVQSGTITQKEAEAWKELHPNYVPTLRADGTEDIADFSAGKQGVFGEQRKKATGGGRQLVPLIDAYEQKISSAMKFGKRNIFFSYLLNDASKYSELGDHMRVLKMIDSAENMTQGQILGEYNNRANTYVAFTKDGGAVVFEVDPVINTAVKDLTNPKLEVEQYLEAWQKVNSLWRGAVTTKNPLFTISNAFRDAGQAMLMSEDVGQYWKNYKNAIQEMKADSELYKQFQASGVMDSSISEGIRKAQKNNVFTRLEGVGEIVEMLPRFSAYLSAIEKYGNTPEGRLQAQFDAKDITTNFSQGGDWTRMLNRNGFNFLNANVQGLLQIGRKITDPIKNQSLSRNQKLQAMGGFAIKMTALGFAPYVINSMLIGLVNPERKRDYEELSDSMKTQYLLFPTSDGKFIRIPYGRALVISTTLANIAQNAIEGKEIDVRESLKTIWDNVGVAKPSGLWTPLVDAHNNKTWYGGTIVNSTLAEREKKDQYDESTDWLSKKLGGLFNVSPKKVNYVLDQWTGFVGDFFMPIGTPKYASNNPLDYAVAPLKSRFTTDAVTNNDLYDTYNDMFTEVKKQASTDGSYYGAEQYFYSQSKEINSIWTQLHEVQRYKSLSQEEKDALQQKYMVYGNLNSYKVRQQIIRDMRKTINGIQRNAIENYDYIINASSKYPITEDMNYSEKKVQTFKMNNDLFGGEYALNQYGGDTWDDAVLANTCGISFDTYAQYISNTADLHADKDDDGKTISGSLKKKKWEALQNMNLSEGERAFIFAMEYSITQKTNYYDSKALQKALNDYIDSLPLSKEEKKYLKENL